jgi:hypothetical protein
MQILEPELLDRPRGLISILQSVDPAVLPATLHPNGFLKVTVSEGSRIGPSLRLHVWPKQGAGESSNVHNHRWRLDSRVLWGVLCAEYFTPGAHGNSYYSWRYMGYDGSVLKATGRTSLQLVSQRLITAGTTYHLRAEALHRVSISSPGGASTLVIRGVVARPCADVYSEAPVPALKSREQLASARIVEEQISIAIERLSEVAT